MDKIEKQKLLNQIQKLYNKCVDMIMYDEPDRFIYTDCKTCGGAGYEKRLNPDYKKRKQSSK